MPPLAPPWICHCLFLKAKPSCSPQVADELRQASLKVREQQEQTELLTREVSFSSERRHAQEEAMMAERVAWDRKLFSLRNQAADSEKQHQQLAESVRLDSQELRAKREVGEQRVKEKEATCRALTATMQELIECSQDFGAFMRSIGPDFLPRDVTK